jgi:hypothetical protein
MITRAILCGVDLIVEWSEAGWQLAASILVHAFCIDQHDPAG